MDISVIIVNYRSEHFLSDCLKSIELGLENFDYEIILINNDEKDLISLKADNYRNLCIINRGVNDGYAKGCNAGAAAAKGDILFFLNPDTKLLEDGVENFFKTLYEEKVAIIAPRIILPSGEIQLWDAGKELDLFSLLLNHFGKINSIKESEIDWVSGAAFAIKKAIFDSIEGFDENFFMYFEDIDLCKRVKSLGYRIKKVPDFSVVHIGGQSYNSSKKQKLDYYRSQDYYFKKNFGFFSFIMVKILRRVLLLAKKLRQV